MAILLSSHEWTQIFYNLPKKDIGSAALTCRAAGRASSCQNLQEVIRRRCEHCMSLDHRTLGCKNFCSLCHNGQIHSRCETRCYICAKEHAGVPCPYVCVGCGCKHETLDCPTYCYMCTDEHNTMVCPDYCFLCWHNGSSSEHAAAECPIFRQSDKTLYYRRRIWPE